MCCSVRLHFMFIVEGLQITSGARVCAAGAKILSFRTKKQLFSSKKNILKWSKSAPKARKFFEISSIYQLNPLVFEDLKTRGGFNSRNFTDLPPTKVGVTEPPVTPKNRRFLTNFGGQTPKIFLKVGGDGRKSVPPNLGVCTF